MSRAVKNRLHSFRVDTLRPSVFVPVLVLAAACVPALVAGCGSSSSISGSDTSQFRSIPNAPLYLTLNWADYVVAPPNPNPTPTPTTSPTPTPTPNPSATPPFVVSDATGLSGITPPAGALSAVITLASSDPDTGSVLVFPPINRDDARPTAYSETYLSALSARTGVTNANVRFYDAKDGLGNALADSTRFQITIGTDGSGLETLPPPVPIPAASPSASPSP